MTSARMLRVLHAPVNVGNHPWVLSRAERELGLASDLVVSTGTWLQYPADLTLAETTTSWRARWRIGWFGLTSPLRYDVLHYYFGQSFLGAWSGKRGWMRFADLRLAKMLGRKVFMTLQGCDARISHRNAERNETSMCQLGHCQYAASCRSDLDAKRQAFLDAVAPRCDRVFVLNPDLVDDVPNATFLPYANVPIHDLTPTPPRTHGPIRLLHAPSDEWIKGTRYLLEAVEKLKPHWDIELILVKNQPHHVAMQMYSQADLVVDQLLAGWYGGFAVEVMALGKPVACFLREADLRHVPAAMRSELPMRRVTIATLARDLETLFEQRQRWPTWGQASRRFVERWHDPRHIAQALAACYRSSTAEFSLQPPSLPEVASCAA